MGSLSSVQYESIATAKRFADIGMNVIVWDKNMELLEATRDDLKSHIGKGYSLVQQCVDITDRNDVGDWRDLFCRLRKRLPNCINCFQMVKSAAFR